MLNVDSALALVGSQKIQRSNWSSSTHIFQ
jgi:hypothetical protein